MNVDGFCDYLFSHDRAVRTVQEYRTDLQLFTEWLEKHLVYVPEQNTITALDIRDWKGHMDSKGWKPSTINRRLASLRAYFSWAQSERLVASNPTTGIRDKRHMRTGPKSLQRARVRDLRRAAEERIHLADLKRIPIKMTATAREARRDKALLYLILGTGLRLSEVCGLCMQDVKIKERSGELQVRSGKGGKYREVPLNLDVRKALNRWLEVRPEDAGDTLFISRLGTPLSTRSVQRILNKLSMKAGMVPEDVSPHVLRHTFAKSLIDAGEPLTKVQALLGHESIVSTARYVSPRKEDLATAVERISWDEDDDKKGMG